MLSEINCFNRCQNEGVSTKSVARELDAQQPQQKSISRLSSISNAKTNFSSILPKANWRVRFSIWLVRNPNYATALAWLGALPLGIGLYLVSNQKKSGEFIQKIDTAIDDFKQNLDTYKKEFPNKNELKENSPIQLEKRNKLKLDLKESEENLRYFVKKANRTFDRNKGDIRNPFDNSPLTDSSREITRPLVEQAKSLLLEYRLIKNNGFHRQVMRQDPRIK